MGTLRPWSVSWTRSGGLGGAEWGGIKFLEFKLRLGPSFLSRQVASKREPWQLG